MIGLAVAVLAASTLANADTCSFSTLSGDQPMVIAHRGASGELPEHTIASYRLAIEQGSDVIEPDLVMTKDGVLIARHDRYLSTTTDVASRPEFADRKRQRRDGVLLKNDWWADDFTLAEIKTLRAIQPRADRSDAFDGQFAIPTFDDVIELAKETGVTIYPETKSPSAHAQSGLDIEAALIEALKDAGWTTASAPVFVQSFEPEILRSLNEEIDVRLVQLVTPIPTPKGLRSNIDLDSIKTYADGVGPNKVLVINRRGGTTDFVSEAHERGLFVHPWTVRDDQAPTDGADVETELTRLFASGVDGVFTDFPQTAIRARQSFCEALSAQ